MKMSEGHVKFIEGEFGNQKSPVTRELNHQRSSELLLRESARVQSHPLPAVRDRAQGRDHVQGQIPKAIVVQRLGVGMYKARARALHRRKVRSRAIMPSQARNRLCRRPVNNQAHEVSLGLGKDSHVFSARDPSLEIRHTLLVPGTYPGSRNKEFAKRNWMLERRKTLKGVGS